MDTAYNNCVYCTVLYNNSYMCVYVTSNGAWLDVGVWVTNPAVYARDYVWLAM